MKSHHGKLTNALVVLKNAWVRIWIWCRLYFRKVGEEKVQLMQSFDFNPQLS